MFLGSYRLMIATKDWNKEGLLIAESTRAFFDKESASQPTDWPGALIGEARPVSHIFSMRRPFPKNPFPLKFPWPFNKLGEDPYFFYTKSEVHLPGINMFLLLKRRWSCWWPDYGENYPVLRLFKEPPLNPYKGLVGLQGRATFFYDPWIHDDYRRAGEPFLLNLGFAFTLAEGEAFAAYQESYGDVSARVVHQYVHRDLVRLQGKATFSYDPWVHDAYGLVVDEAALGLRLWEFANVAFMKDFPGIREYSSLLPVPSKILPKLFSMEQILQLKKDYEAQFEFYDPNIIVTPGGRPVLERKILKRFLPALDAMGWHNYPSSFHLRTCSALWTKEPFNWENHPLDYRVWRTLHSEDWLLKQYFKKLKMTVKRADRYVKKRQAEDAVHARWRSENIEEWLAFVRDDPRDNTRMAKDDIFEYKQALELWRPGHKNLDYFREF